MALKMSFEPRWKEELVCTCDLGTFILEYSMGIETTYFPTESAWASSAPAWAVPFWAEIHEQLVRWCAEKRVPLHVEEDARIYEPMK
jgi:hypothetical protein